MCHRPTCLRCFVFERKDAKSPSRNVLLLFAPLRLSVLAFKNTGGFPRKMVDEQRDWQIADIHKRENAKRNHPINNIIMNKFILATLIATAMVQTIPAQDNNRPHMTPQQRTEQRIQKLDEKLSLTDNQKSQIRDLYADFYKQKYPQDKRKEAMEKLITDITATLTADQQVLYKQLQEEAAAERRKHAPKN